MKNGGVSHWWSITGDAHRTRPELPGRIQVDVAIVGAGYTGLWTAYYLKRADPSLRVAVIEQRHVGYGASGRNGGWLTNSITGRARYAASHGHEEAERFQRTVNETVDEVIAVASAEGIDADIKKGGQFVVAYTPAQEVRVRAIAAAEREWRSADAELLEAPQAMQMINVANTRAAIWHPHAARIQPAKLVAGLANAVERLGVPIYEGTRASQIQPRKVKTTHGDVDATYVVRATEGFTAQLAGLRRVWLPMNSSMIATEPLPAHVWDELRWSGGEVLGDMAHVYMYAQRTADDRIAIGGRGVPYQYGSRSDLDGETAEGTAKKLHDIMNRLFPATRDAAIAHTWSGVLGVPRDWSATVGLDRSTGIAWGGGYVGTGVTITNLAGRTITDLILDRTTDLTSLPWVNHRVRRWEPEPLRWIATKSLYSAYGIADKIEAKGGTRTPPIARLADVVSGRKPRDASIARRVTS